MTRLITLLCAAALTASAQITSIPTAGGATGGGVGGALSLTEVGNIPRVESAGILGLSKLSCTLGVCTVYDDTATTGATTLNIKPGAGQSTTALWNVWLNTAGTTPGAHITGAGLFGIGTTSPDRLFHVELADAATNAVSYASRTTHTTSGTAAAGFGVGHEWELENAAGSNVVALQERVSLESATAGAETTSWGLWRRKAGAADTRVFELIYTDRMYTNFNFLSTYGSNIGDATSGKWGSVYASPGGTVPACATYTVAYSNAAFVAASTTADVTLFALPAKGKITGMTIKHSAQYTDGAGAMTEVGVSVGDGTSHTAYSASQNIGEATAVADTTFTDTSQFKSTTMAASNVVAHFTATGRDFGDGANSFLTAGSANFSVCWVVLP